MKDIAYGVIIGMLAALAGVVLGARLTASPPGAAPAMVSSPAPMGGPGLAPPMGAPGAPPGAPTATAPAGAPGETEAARRAPSGEGRVARERSGERATEGAPGGPGGGAPSSEGPAPPVRPRGPGQPLTFTGTVMPRRVAVVTSAVAGPVARVFVREGQKVAKGQPLFEMEHLDATRRLMDAQATLKDAKAQVQGSAEASGVPPVLPSRPPSAEGERRAERPGRATTPTPSARLDPQARLVLAEMEWQRAKRAVEQATVRAPIAGVVQALPPSTPGGGRQGAALMPPAEPALPEVGTAVSPNTPLCAIVGTGRPVISFTVNEVDLGRIYGGQYASIQPLAFPNVKLTGRVIAIGPVTQARPGNATFPVTVEVISPLGRVRYGMSARVTLLEKTKEASSGAPNRPSRSTRPAS